MCLIIGTPKNINFLFETNGKLMILGVPILKHFRVYSDFLQKQLGICTLSALLHENSLSIKEIILIFLYVLSKYTFKMSHDSPP